WYFGVAELAAPMRSFAQVQFASPAPQGPFTLDSISIRFGNRVSIQEGAFLFGDLLASSAPPPAPFAAGQMVAGAGPSSSSFAQAQVVADFESLETWQPVQGMTQQPLADELRSLDHSGASVTEL